MLTKESECGIKVCKAGQRDILPQIVAVPPDLGRLRPMLLEQANG